MPWAVRPKLVLERDPLVVLGAVDNVDKHVGQRLSHAFGLFVRAAPLGLTGSEASPAPGLRTGSFHSPRSALGWLRDVPSGRAAKDGDGSLVSPAPRRGVLKTETRDRQLVRLATKPENSAGRWRPRFSPSQKGTTREGGFTLAGQEPLLLAQTNVKARSAASRCSGAAGASSRLEPAPPPVDRNLAAGRQPRPVPRRFPDKDRTARRCRAGRAPCRVPEGGACAFHGSQSRRRQASEGLETPQPTSSLISNRHEETTPRR
jgi:hypothetical protein